LFDSSGLYQLFGLKLAIQLVADPFDEDFAQVFHRKLAILFCAIITLGFMLQDDGLDGCFWG
jgi:hypothetical protein